MNISTWSIPQYTSQYQTHEDYSVSVSYHHHRRQGQSQRSSNHHPTTSTRPSELNGAPCNITGHIKLYQEYVWNDELIIFESIYSFQAIDTLFNFPSGTI